MDNLLLKRRGGCGGRGGCAASTTRLFPLLWMIQILLASCGLVELALPNELCIVFPQIPASWKGAEDLVWELHWIDEGGCKRDITSGAGGAFITVRRGFPQSIVAYPKFRGIKLFPAAGIYPFEAEPSRLKLDHLSPTIFPLDFDSGYSACIAASIEKTGGNPWIYPIHRLKTAWIKRSVDPWGIAPEKAALELLADGFGSPLYAGQKAGKIEIELPEGEDWLPENPFNLIEKRDGKIFSKLSPGISYYFGAGKKLIVRLEESGNSAF